MDEFITKAETLLDVVRLYLVEKLGKCGKCGKGGDPKERVEMTSRLLGALGLGALELLVMGRGWWETVVPSNQNVERIYGYILSYPPMILRCLE